MTSRHRILIVDTCYPAFLTSIGYSTRATGNDSYQGLLGKFFGYRFGTSNAYSTNLTPLGWDAQEVIPNSLLLQSAWAHEHGRQLSTRLAQLPHSYLSRVPAVRSATRLLPTFHRVLEAQVSEHQPDVLYFQDLNFVPPPLLRRLQKRGALIVGQIASPLPPAHILRSYDLILSSLPNQVEQIRAAGVASEFLGIGFDTRLNQELENLPRDLPVTFVGGVSRQHESTQPLLEAVAAADVGLSIFGYGAEQLPGHLQTLHRGQRWGFDMYTELRRSAITLNRHIRVAEGYSNNMRLFEATGVAATLVTDRGKNLNQYFSDDEVLSYSTVDEAVDCVRWALEHYDEARRMADRAQRRTTTEHSYESRMRDLDKILRHAL